MFTVNEGVLKNAGIKNLVDLRVLSALVVNCIKLMTLS